MCHSISVNPFRASRVHPSWTARPSATNPTSDLLPLLTSAWYRHRMDSSSGRIGAGGPQGDAGDETIDAVREVGDAPPKEAPPTASERNHDDYVSLIEVDPSHYVMGDSIGRGGMGRIVSARDRRFGRPVAIKQLLPENSAARQRFEQEARITAALQHPGIVNVYEAGVWPSGEPFYAMKHVVGRSLDKVIAEQKTLQARLALLPHAVAVCDAIAYAHSRKVIHRDLKPSNVLVGEFGETVIIDWGLAKDLKAQPELRRHSRPMAAVSEDHTGDGGVIGTPAYMPPEQARGEPVGKPADVYALGAVLYAMMAGEPPYTGSSSRVIIDQVAAGPPEPLERRQPGVPADLLAIVDKAMARRPEDRYRTAKDFAADLKRFRTGQLVGAYRYSPRERFVRLIRRYRVAASVAVVAVVVLAVVAGLSISRILDERETAHRERETAQRERQRATLQAVELLKERGRQELLAGRAGPALAYLTAAAKDGAMTPSLALLIAEARRPFELEDRRLEGHEGRVYVAVFSPDGRRIVSAGHDNTARVWDDSGELLETLAHDGPVSFAAFSPDGGRIVTASADNSARLWHADGRHIADLSHDALVLHAAFSAEGDKVVTSGAGGTAAVWDAYSGDPLAALVGHTEPVLRAEFSLDGARIVTASPDDTAIVWTADGSVHRVLEGHTNAVVSAAFSADLPGSRVVTASLDGTARIWDAESGRQSAVLQGHAAEVFSAVFRKDDAYVVTASADRTARVWDAQTGALRATFDGHSDAVVGALYSSEQTAVVTASVDGSVRVWDPVTETARLSLEGHAGMVTHVAVDTSGTRLLSAGVDGTVRIWRARDSNRPPRISTPGEVSSVVFDATGARLVTGSSDTTARAWDAKTGDEQQTIAELDSTVFDARLSPDGQRIALAGGGLVQIVTLGGDKLIELHGHQGDVNSAVFSPDGGRVASGGADATVRVWDPETGEQLLSLSGHEDGVNSVRYSSDGRRLLTASTDGSAIVWDVSTGQRLLRLDGRGPLSSAVFSPNGQHILLAGRAGAEARRGDGTVVFTLEGAGLVYSAEYSRPDGALIATASADRTARIWDAETGKLLAVRQGQTDELLSVAFSPDANALATSSRDGTVVVWDIHRDTSSVAETEAFLKQRVPWKLVDGRLLPVRP